MKTFNQLKMRSLSRKLGVLSLTLALASACGGKDSNNTDSATNTVVTTNTTTVSTNDANFTADWESIKASTTCVSENGKSWGRATDRTYYTTGNNTVLTNGAISGTATGFWLGKNSTNGSAVAVQKVIAGGVVYYNIVVSTCIIGSSNSTGEYTILDDGDNLTDVQFTGFSRSYSESYGLDCSHDFVANATFIYTSSKYTTLNNGVALPRSLKFATNYYDATCY
jgi:hypothetical protein